LARRRAGEWDIGSVQTVDALGRCPGPFPQALCLRGLGLLVGVQRLAMLELGRYGRFAWS